ncbi:hypothetical protein [Corallococcus macrosporus]|uniref:Uncharacterized protein n=1 Tax=Corallococcus macrosporus DSM 14697 TaxID=1189310 RepID=A0A250JP30_9BACT|nr:hypothetical protein [Corallococcus macrosporus]ATB45423.1 hypothetical protein MYMAC_001008 [Corallococcus macrosporus DSM 14697]
MLLRVLTLLVVLGLPPIAGAAEGLFHLCQGTVKLDLTCACHQAKRSKAAPVSQEAGILGDHQDCCGELAVRLPAPEPVTASAGPSWTLAPLALPPQAVTAAPPAPEALPSSWVRIRGVHHATAPPLYLRHCSYLI